ncbi:hypothetical protein JCM3774_005043 [Rhodotorula dairenensis]
MSLPRATATAACAAALPPNAARSVSAPDIPAKRSASPAAPAPAPAPAPPPAAKKRKRARVTVDPDETTQVTGLDDRYKLHLADADAYYIPDLVDPATAQHWHDQLLALDQWYRPTLKVYGRQVTQSRQIAAFATERDLQVKYSGAAVEMSYDYPPLLREIQDLVEEKLQVKFNHVMLNRYENGQIYIGNHRDNRENRVIASLSLGAPRTFVLTHDKPPAPKRTSSSTTTTASEPEPASDRGDCDSTAKAGKVPAAQEKKNPLAPPLLLYSHRFQLESGSLLVMQGTMQQFWKHQIPKESRIRDSRISLTFRQLVF